MQPKWFLKSKTIIGLLITVLPTVAELFGLTLTPGDVNFISAEMDKVIMGMGAALVVIGRFKSTTSVKLLPQGK